jgi:D-alanine-D-alanine ligase
MDIILTYDPRWKYMPEGKPPLWDSLNSVDYVTCLLEEIGINIFPVAADYNFEGRINLLRKKYSKALVFWLNEFMPTVLGQEIFTVKVIEKVGLMHTGPSSDALAKGLDKEATKNIFRKIGLLTPESLVVYPGDYTSINQCANWDDFVIVKPLLKGCSKGIDEHSVIYSGDFDAIMDKVEQLHKVFNEPAFIERFIGGDGAREYTIPILISYEGKIADLPITEIDLSQLPSAQGKFRYLTQEFKQENRAEFNLTDKPFLKIPADIPPEAVKKIRSDVRKIINTMRCRDLTRVDIRADTTGWYYIEVNVNPGKNRSSYLIVSASSLGLNYSELIAFIPYQAMLKYGLKPPRKLEELTKPVMELFQTSSAFEHALVN